MEKVIHRPLGADGRMWGRSLAGDDGSHVREFESRYRERISSDGHSKLSHRTSTQESPAPTQLSRYRL